MNPKDFWTQYMGELTPAEFMARFQSRNPARVVERHVQRMPGLYGIVRRKTWRETFAAPAQYSRELIAAGLTAYLEETRQEWEEAVKHMAVNGPLLDVVEEPPVEETPAEETFPMEEIEDIEAAIQASLADSGLAFDAVPGGQTGGAEPEDQPVPNDGAADDHAVETTS